MGVLFNVQGDFEMRIKSLKGEDIDPEEEREEEEEESDQTNLQTGEFFVTMERRKIVDYAGGQFEDVYNFDLEPCDWTEYSFEHFNEL